MHGETFCWIWKRTAFLVVASEDDDDGPLTTSAGGEGGGERLIALDCATSTLSVWFHDGDGGAGAGPAGASAAQAGVTGSGDRRGLRDTLGM